MKSGRLSAGIVAALAFAALTVPMPGRAQTTAAVDPATGAPIANYPSNIAVQIPVTASIATDCGFDPNNGPSGDIHAGELNGAFDQQVNFGLRCPTPLNVGIVSQNGGLLAPGTPEAGYTAQRDYNVELHLVGSSPYSADADCLASTLVTTGSCLFRGPATSAMAGGGLYLDGYAQNGAGYVTGSYLRVHGAAYGGTPVLIANSSYQDTLTVTLSAVL